MLEKISHYTVFIFLFGCMQKFGYHSVHQFCESLCCSSEDNVCKQLFVVVSVILFTDVYCNVPLYFLNTGKL